MASREEVIAELQRRGAFSDPAKAPVVAELVRRGLLPQSVTAPATENLTAKLPGIAADYISTGRFPVEGALRTGAEVAKNAAGEVADLGRTAVSAVKAVPGLAADYITTGQVPKDKLLSAGKGLVTGLAGQAKELFTDPAGALVRHPVATVSTVAPLLPKVGQAAGAAGRAVEAGVGAIPETSARALSAGKELARGTVTVPVHAARSIADGLSDFFSGTRPGTTRMRGEIGPVPKIDEAAVQDFAQSLEDTVAAHKQMVGSKINGAFAEHDAKFPNGAIPVADVRAMVERFASETGVDKVIAGKQKAIKPVIDDIRATLDEFVKQNTPPAPPERAGHGLQAAPVKPMRTGLSLRELKNLTDELLDDVNFKGLELGDKKAIMGRVLKLTGALSNRLAEASPAAAKALREYSVLIGDSQAIEHVFGVTGSQTVGPKEAIELTNKLDKFIRQRDVVNEVTENVVRRVGGPELLKEGQKLAVAQQLQGTLQPGLTNLGVYWAALKRLTTEPGRLAMPGVASVTKRMTEAVDRLMGATRVGADTVRSAAREPVRAFRAARSVQEFTEKLGEHNFAAFEAATDGMKPWEVKLRTEEMVRDLHRSGHTVFKADGVFEGKANPSVFVPDIDVPTAQRLAVKYSQRSVLTRQGLVDQTGKVTPAVENSLKVGTPDDFVGQDHTVVHIGNRKFGFSVKFPE